MLTYHDFRTCFLMNSRVQEFEHLCVNVGSNLTCCSQSAMLGPPPSIPLFPHLQSCCLWYKPEVRATRHTIAHATCSTDVVCEHSVHSRIYRKARLNGCTTIALTVEHPEAICRRTPGTIYQPWAAGMLYHCSIQRD